MWTTHSQPQLQETTPSGGGQARDRLLRVLVVDDHPAVLAGVMQLLEEQPDLTVVDAVDSATAGLSLAERGQIDVAVVDYQLGSRSGLWLSRMLKRLDSPPRVVVYSAYCDGPLAAACVVAEADALVSKGSVGNALCDAVRAVADGATCLPRVPSRLAETMRRRLWPDEQAIFGLLLAGIETSEVAETLGISRDGLNSRMWAMLRKLEGLGSDCSEPRSFGAPPLRPRRW